MGGRGLGLTLCSRTETLRSKLGTWQIFPIRAFIYTSIVTLVILIPLGNTWVKIAIDSDTRWEDRPLAERTLGRISFVAATPGLIFNRLNVGPRSAMIQPLVVSWVFWSFFFFLLLKSFTAIRKRWDP